MCNELCALCCVRSCSSCIRCWLNRCGWVQKVKKYLEFERRPYMMYTSSFQRNLQIYWLYYLFRWVIFLLSVSSVVVTVGEFGGKGATKKRPVKFYLKYPIYLTYLTLILAVVQTFQAVIIVTRGVRRYGFTDELPSGGKLSCFQLIYFKLMMVNTTLAMTITLVFWLAIFPRLPNAQFDINNVLAHGCNFIYALVDMVVNGLPYNFSDIVWSVIYLLIYAAFTFAYWHAGGWPRPLPGDEEPITQVIYPKCLDWSSFKHPVMCAVAVSCQLLASHIILCGLMQAKIRWMPKFDDPSDASSTASATKAARSSGKVTPGRGVV